jgi:hypothetical protein
MITCLSSLNFSPDIVDKNPGHFMLRSPDNTHVQGDYNGDRYSKMV